MPLRPSTEVLVSSTDVSFNNSRSYCGLEISLGSIGWHKDQLGTTQWRRTEKCHFDYKLCAIVYLLDR